MKCTLTLCSNLGEKKLMKRLEAASRMTVVQINHVEYNVLDGDMDRSCSCKKFDIEQLTCKHVVVF